uniref:Uncharacterized protein n=1 Tax=Meloidogyne incognita TaxID=6306 RepID=A0A914NF15_MELIC
MPNLEDIGKGMLVDLHISRIYQCNLQKVIHINHQALMSSRTVEEVLGHMQVEVPGHMRVEGCISRRLCWRRRRNVRWRCWLLRGNICWWSGCNRNINRWRFCSCWRIWLRCWSISGRRINWRNKSWRSTGKFRNWCFISSETILKWTTTYNKN